jgi:DNA-binding CsgD family transcriptional regulator
MAIPFITPLIGQDNGTLPPATALANVLSSAQAGPGLLVMSQTRQCLFRNAEAARLMRELRQRELHRRPYGDIPRAVLRCCRDLEHTLDRHPNPRSWGRVQLVRVLGGEGNIVLTRFQAIPTPGEPARISFIVGLLEPLSLSPQAAKTPSRPAFPFSEREQACVTHLIQGMTDKEIARHMGISEYTVKDHFKKIRQKTGAPNRAGIITRVLGRTRAQRNGSPAGKALEDSAHIVR